MRILSGKLKGSKILTNNKRTKGNGSFITRPTSDRVKETLFNILQHGFDIDFQRISFLDCFSGSGAVGLEAISRGCAIVSFIEKNNYASDCIIKNLSNFDLYKNEIANDFRIFNFDFFDQKLVIKNMYDLIFLDPPYEQIKFGKLFMRLRELGVTKITSLIIYESKSELKKTDGLQIVRSKKIGKTHLNFLKVLG